MGTFKKMLAMFMAANLSVTLSTASVHALGSGNGHVLTEAEAEDAGTADETVVNDDLSSVNAVSDAGELNGIEETDEPAAETFAQEIVGQPSDLALYSYQTASFRVDTNAEATNYQWQYSKNGGGNWSNLSQNTYGNTDTLTFTAKSTHNGYQYRCAVTFADGEKKYSDPAVLMVLANEIISQPDDATVFSYDTAEFRIEKTGVEKYCQWQVSKDGGNAWGNLSRSTYGSTEVLSFKAKASYNGYRYRCVVYYKDGTSIVSEDALLTVTSGQIISQPADAFAAEKGTAEFTVGVAGNVKTCQWQYSKNGGASWSNLSKTVYGSTTTLSFAAKKSQNGYRYRCVVTMTDGTKLTSESAVLSIQEAQTFTTSGVTASVTVDAPAGAFPEDTVMAVEALTEEQVDEKLISAIDLLECGTVQDARIINLSFDNQDGSHEPSVPVVVSLEFAVPLAEADYYAVIHVKDDGTTEKVEDAVVTRTGATFTAKGFSTYEILAYTNRYTFVDVPGNIAFYPTGISGADAITQIPVGPIAENAPEFEGYTFRNATVQVGNNIDVALEIGAFKAVYDKYDDNGTPDDPSDDIKFDTPVEYEKVFYRTQETLNTSDIIVLIAGSVITLNYDVTPRKVTYQVVYNGTTYTIGTDQLPADLADLIVDGPERVPGEGQDQAVNVVLPRGFSGDVRVRGDNGLTVNEHLGTEPTYTLSSDNKSISVAAGSPTYVDLDGVYDLPSGNHAVTVTVTVTKRNSYSFNARYFLATVYAGGAGTGTLGDTAITGNNGNKCRLTTDNAYTLNSATVANRGIRSFTADGTVWAFETVDEASDDISAYGDRWMLDALEINGTTIELPYAETLAAGASVSKSTTLPSGTVITVTLDGIRNAHAGQSGRQRHYTISAENCYEDLVITGGNIVNAASSTEIIAEVLDNVNYSFYGYSSSDRAFSGTGLGWQNWRVGEPIAVGANQSVNNGRNYNMYGFNQLNNDAMRFTVPEGYEDPEIALTDGANDDLIQYIEWGGNLGQGSKTSAGYYPVTGNPTNGYYYFRLRNYTSIGSKIALLRIRSYLMRFGVGYESDSDVANPVLPGYDDGGHYESGALRGYNVADNDEIVISKTVPADPADEYIFSHYTIGNSSVHYAPGQKVELTSIWQYHEEKQDGEYPIILTAHWIKKETAEKVNFTVRFILDDDFNNPYDVITQVTKRSAIYVDIDSDEMVAYMERYDWQLFYDEISSSPFVESVDEEHNLVTLHLYSKFYVYHSSSGQLELHTTKEMETGTGDERRIGTLNLTAMCAAGTLYGGYYSDYAGAYSEGNNLVQERADDDNDNGTLDGEDIARLSAKQFKVIGQNIGTIYTVNDQSGFWSWDAAYKADGTAMRPVRAAIYYLKEVPTYFLRNYYQLNYRKSDLVLTGMYLISAVDDLNYQNSGLTITQQGRTAEIVDSLTFLNQATGRSVTLIPSVVFKSLGITGTNYDGYLTYIDITGTQYFNVGTFTVLPYWTTPDGVKVDGISTRTVTISDMKLRSVSKSDETPANP